MWCTPRALDRGRSLAGFRYVLAHWSRLVAHSAPRSTAVMSPASSAVRTFHVRTFHVPRSTFHVVAASARRLDRGGVTRFGAQSVDPRRVRPDNLNVERGTRERG